MACPHVHACKLLLTLINDLVPHDHTRRSSSCGEIEECSVLPTDFPLSPGEAPVRQRDSPAGDYEYSDDYDDTEVDGDDDGFDEEKPLKPKTKRKPPIIHKWNV